MNPFADLIPQKTAPSASMAGNPFADLLPNASPAPAQPQGNAEPAGMFSQGLNNAETKAKNFYGENSLAYKATLPGRAVLRTGAFLGDILSGSTQKFGTTIGNTGAVNDNANKYNEALQTHTDLQNKLQKAIYEKQKSGQDASRLQQTLNNHVANTPQLQDFTGDVINKTGLQVAGEGAGTFADIAGLGTYGKGFVAGEKGIGLGNVLTNTGRQIPSKVPTVVSGLSSKVPSIGNVMPKVSTILKSTAKKVGINSAVGEGYDVAQNLQQGETGTNIVTKGYGKYIGAGLGTFAGGVLGGINAYKYAKTGAPQKQAVNELEQAYTDWMSGTTPGKKKIAKIETKTILQNKAGTEGKTPMRTLAEEGILPNRTGTKLDTFNQSTQYREKIAPLREANQQALQETGLGVQERNLTDLENKAISYAKTPQNINSGRFDKMVREIRREFALLKKNYPTGKIPLSVQDDIKSARWDNVFKNKGLIDADVLKKDSEYAIAKALQKDIEEVTSQAGNPEVAQLNREIGDRLEAAKYLEDLNGKTIKGGRLMKYVTTGIGASFGTTIPGKILGALGGNVVGELIIANNVANPVKRMLLRNLQTKDPQAYTKTIQWLQTQNLNRETRLLLPAPKQPVGVNQGRAIPVFPSGQKGVEYIGKNTVIGGDYSKSPTAQQTSPAITTVSKNPIDNSMPQMIKNASYVDEYSQGFSRPDTREVPLGEHLPPFKTTSVKQSVVNEYNTAHSQLSQKLNQLRTEKSILEDTVQNHEGKIFTRYANKNGELPEVLGVKGQGKFKQSGDSIAKTAGLESSNDAQKSLDEYKQAKLRLNELNKEIIDTKNTLRQTPNPQRGAVPLRTLTGAGVGSLAGFQKDDNGNIKYDAKRGALGALAGAGVANYKGKPKGGLSMLDVSPQNIAKKMDNVDANIMEQFSSDILMGKRVSGEVAKNAQKMAEQLGLVEATKGNVRLAKKFSEILDARREITKKKMGILSNPKK